MQLFTFGRQREKECAVHYLKDQKHVPLIHAVVDAVHDLLEARVTEDVIRFVMSQAFVEGGTGVWEQTGAWLRKLTPTFPALQSLWLEFATHPQSKVRFRAACFVDEMPPSLAVEVGNLLKVDSSKKVRAMAQARLEATRMQLH